MKKVLYVATVVKTHIMEFHLPYLKLFRDLGWKTAVAAKNDYAKQEECVIPNCDVYYDIPFSRSPLKHANVIAYQKLKAIIDQEEYDIVHCHTPVGAVVARLAARDARKKGVTKVVYTAHGFHFYRHAPLINWLLYYPVEWLCSFWTDVLITINQEDYARARRHMHAGKTVYLPGVGIDLNKFDRGTAEERDHAGRSVRTELGIPDHSVLVLSVGELIPRKNHEIVLRALAKMGRPDVHYAIAGSGPLAAKYKALAEALGIADRVHILGWRSDIHDLLCAADLFIHPSHQEGLPVALMEAMAMGLPCVVSRIRGNADLMDAAGGLQFDPLSVQDCRDALERMLQMDFDAMGRYNAEKIKAYDFDGAIKAKYLACIEDALKETPGAHHA